MLPYPFATEAVTSYGAMLVLALLVCWMWARRLAPAFGIDRTHVDLAVPVVFLLSAIGARVLAAIVADAGQIGIGFHETHVRFRLFGLLLLAVPPAFAYARLAGISFRQFVDLFAVPAVAWLVVVRVGCFLAGCCWGDVTASRPRAGDEFPAQVLTLEWLAGDWIPALSFPPGSYAYEQHLAFGLIDSSAASSLPVHATQLYEMLLLLVLLVLLQKRARPGRVPGSLALIALSSYAIIRFLLEFVRADSVPLSMDLTATQLICVGVLLLAWPLNRALVRSVA